MARKPYKQKKAEAVFQDLQVREVEIAPNAPINDYLLANLNYLFYTNISTDVKYSFDFSELERSIKITMNVINFDTVDHSVQISSLYKFLISAGTVSVLVFEVSNGSITFLNKSTSISTTTSTNQGYIQNYQFDLNKQFENTSFFCNYFKIPDRTGTNYRTIPYNKIFDTPDLQLSGQENLFYTFTEGQRDQTCFWRNNTYTVAYTKNTVTEAAIIAALGPNEYFPKMCRIRMILTTNVTTSPVYDAFNNTQDNWAKEEGRLRDRLINSPGFLLSHINEIEIWGLDSAGNYSYIYHNPNYSVAPTAIISLGPASNFGNYWNWIENAEDITNGVYAPFYSRYQRIQSASPFVGQVTNINPANFNSTATSIRISNLSMLDRPPVFLQGKLSLSFTGSNITGMSFTSFDAMGLTSITYPNDLFISSHSPYREPSLQNVLSILADPSIPTPSYRLPGFDSPTYKPFPSGYFGFIQ